MANVVTGFQRAVQAPPQNRVAEGAGAAQHLPDSDAGRAGSQTAGCPGIFRVHSGSRRSKNRAEWGGGIGRNRPDLIGCKRQLHSEVPCAPVLASLADCMAHSHALLCIIHLCKEEKLIPDFIESGLSIEVCDLQKHE